MTDCTKNTSFSKLTGCSLYQSATKHSPIFLMLDFQIIKTNAYHVRQSVYLICSCESFGISYVACFVELKMYV